jgi:recombinational DNA repair protein RecT
MSTEPTTIATRPPGQPARVAPPAKFRLDVERMATSMIMEILGSEQGKQAAARCALAFAATARAARNPENFYACTPESVGQCIAYSAITNLMPGGPAPQVWLTPRQVSFKDQDGRWQKRWELGWSLSHRGVAALLIRSGWAVMPVAVGPADKLRIDFGEVVEHEADPDFWPDDLDDVLGVYLSIRNLTSGVTLFRPWLPREAIKRRRAASDAYRSDVEKGRKATDEYASPWLKWPVEMAQKTAMHWSLARGLLPVSGVEFEIAMTADGTDAHQRVASEPTKAPASLGTAAPPRQIEAPAEEATFEPVREREVAEVRAEEPTSASAAQPSGSEEHPSRGSVAPQGQDATTGRQEAQEAEPPKPDEREALKALIEVEVKRLGGRGRVCEIMGWDISAWKDVASWKFGADRLTATLEKLKAAEPKAAKSAPSDGPDMP